MEGVKKRGISGSTVKLVGIITMFIDHFAAALMGRELVRRGLGMLYFLGSTEAIDQWWQQNGLLYYSCMALRLVGRLGFPIFCFLLVEGFMRTRSKAKYALRLFIFALLSEIPFDLAFSASVLEFDYQNVYFTLFLGLLALCAYDWLAKGRLPVWVRWILCIAGVLLATLWLGILVLPRIPFLEGMLALAAYILLFLAVIVAFVLYGRKRGRDSALSTGADLVVLSLLMLLAEFLRTDYGGMGVLTITVMYLFRKNRVASMAGGCVVLTLMTLSEITAFFALIPVAFYNGERGLKLKYFFYAFYPVHLLLLWLVAWLLGMGSIPVV